MQHPELLSLPLDCASLRAAEQRAFEAGVDPAALMEFAAAGVVAVIRQFFPEPGRAVVFAGKGNNGGDALVVARLLAEAGWRTGIELAAQPDDLADLPRRMLERARAAGATGAHPKGPLIAVDGLLGNGAEGPLRGAVLEAARHLRALREEHGAQVIAIDLPSGVDADTGTVHPGAVRADITVTLGLVKPGLLADESTDFVGRLALVPLPQIEKWLPPTSVSEERVMLPAAFPGWLRRRAFDFHKGQAGRVTLWAGGPGCAGAARLCSAAAVRAGAGLVTLRAPEAMLEMLATACIPEVMVRSGETGWSKWNPSDAMGMGPGMGRDADHAIQGVVKDYPGILVIDADALNAIAGNLELLKDAAGVRILTPHPGEMERLFPRENRTRREWARAFAASHPNVVILLKGARTIITMGDGPIYFNTTGSPGMATGGMGDVLTGVITALCARGIDPLHAAALGAWLCGRAAESALCQGESEESLAASDVISHLGSAFSAWMGIGF